MKPDIRPSRHWYTRTISRRAMLQRGGTVATLTMVGGPTVLRTGTAHRVLAAGGAALQPHPAVQSLLTAIERYPLVALGERHFLQEWHDLVQALLFHPELPTTLTDIAVEFGNAYYQDLADRFILDDQPVARETLAQIWRYALGWDSPVYEQFFRTVRAVNWMRPRAHRIRVLLGTPPFNVPAVKGAADPDFRRWWQEPIDPFYAAAVEREVLAKGRRALLIAGGGHLLRGVYAEQGSRQLNAASLLAQRHAGALYVVDTLILPPGPQQDAIGQRMQTAVAAWPRPAIAPLAGTWLGMLEKPADYHLINDGAHRAVSAAAARLEAQADALLYLGPGEALTVSQADPTLFQTGAYRAELQRLSRIISQIDGQSEDLVADALQLARTGPNWFSQFPQFAAQ